MKYAEMKIALTRFLLENEGNIPTNEYLAGALKIVDGWVHGVVGGLEQRVKDWEMVEETAGGLYTLGLRRAIDDILGESALDKLPVLETEGTPDPFEVEGEDG